MNKKNLLIVSTIVLIIYIALCVYNECGIKKQQPIAKETIQEVVDEVFKEINQQDKTKVKPKIDYLSILNKKSINFKSNSYQTDDISALDDIVDILKKDEKIKLTIIGHTDNKGDKKYNNTLGAKRANSIKNYFVNNGIAKNRLTTISEGDISPIAKNDTDENKAKNRRVEFKGELK